MPEDKKPSVTATEAIKKGSAAANPTQQPTGDAAKKDGQQAENPEEKKDQNQQGEQQNNNDTAKNGEEKKAKTEETSEVNGQLTDNDANIYINEELAKIVKGEKIQFDNGQQFNISIFFVPKFIFDKNANTFKEENLTFLRFNRDVSKIVINDRLADFGYNGYIDIVNSGEQFNFILDRLNCYHLVINFRLAENETCGIRFEPFIFDVTSVSNVLDNSGETKQILRLNFVDIFTYIAQQHSMATVIKFDPNISKKSSYREVFAVILDYFKRFIKVNYNGLYTIKKDLHFSTDKEGSADVKALVEHSFKKMDPTCTVYEGLNILLRDCCSPIRSTRNFKAEFNDFDYMLVPMFFKEEFGDLLGFYNMVFDPIDNKSWQSIKNTMGGKVPSFLKKLVEKTQDAVDTAQKIIDRVTPSEPNAERKAVDKKINDIDKKINGNVAVKSQQYPSSLSFPKMLAAQNFNNTDDLLVLRPMSLRDVHMPFTICFTKGGNVIHESINPSKDKNGNFSEKEKSFICLNGRNELGIANYMYFPTNQDLVQKLWKNMVICNLGQSEGETSTVLIEFNWVYQYYIYNFLGYGTGRNEGYTSNITPSFFLAQKNKLIDNKGLLADFNEMNANFQVIRSETDLNETLCYIGKNLTSFITQNDTYQFKVRGNMFRRPNEIIKVSNNKNEESTNPSIAFHTDLANNDYILMYVTSVQHTWEGNKYYNNISANKIYERVINDTAT